MSSNLTFLFDKIKNIMKLKSILTKSWSDQQLVEQSVEKEIEQIMKKILKAKKENTRKFNEAKKLKNISLISTFYNTKEKLIKCFFNYYR